MEIMDVKSMSDEELQALEDRINEEQADRFAKKMHNAGRLFLDSKTLLDFAGLVSFCQGEHGHDGRIDEVMVTCAAGQVGLHNVQVGLSTPNSH